MVDIDTPSGTELVVIEDINTLGRILELTRPDCHARVRAMLADEAGWVSHPEMCVGTRVRLVGAVESHWYRSGWGLALGGYPGVLFAIEAFETVEKAIP